MFTARAIQLEGVSDCVDERIGLESDANAFGELLDR